MFNWFTNLFKKKPDAKPIVKPLPLDKIKDKNNRILITAKNLYLIGQNLQGCIRDSINWHSYLTELGFDESCFRILLNENATAEAEKAGLKWLSETKGDYAIWVNSGHGIILDNGDAATVSFDFDFGNQESTSVSSSCVEDILSNTRKETKILIFIDSCHSQDTHLKALSKGRSKRLENPNSKDVLTAKTIGHTLLDCVYFAACLHNETAADGYFSGVYEGAFSHFLLPNLKASGNPKAVDVADKTKTELNKAGYTQHCLAQGEEKALPVF